MKVGRARAMARSDVNFGGSCNNVLEKTQKRKKRRQEGGERG